MNTKQVIILIINALLIVFLCSSCYTYKEVEGSIHDIEMDKKYKIITINKDRKILRISTITDSNLVKTFRKREVKISLHTVRRIKKRKFSPFKTFVVLPVSIATIGAGYVFLTDFSVPSTNFKIFY